MKEQNGNGAGRRLRTAAEFDAFYRANRDRVWLLCRSILRDDARADDLTQETFVRALGNRSVVCSEEPLPWLFTVARNLCIDDLRRRAKETLVAEHAESPSGAPAEGASEDAADAALRRMRARHLRASLTAALSSLTSRDRRIVILSTEENLSHETIAAMEGSSVNAVRNVTWRARNQLRKMLAHERSLLIPVFVAIRWLRSLPGRAKRRAMSIASRMNPLAVEATAERAMSFGAIVLAGVIVAVILPGSTPSNAAGGARAEATIERAVSLEGVDVLAASAARTLPPPVGVKASARAGERRDKAVGPSSAGVWVEVKDKDGNTVVWYQLTSKCFGDGRSLAPASPIQQSC